MTSYDMTSGHVVHSPQLTARYLQGAGLQAGQRAEGDAGGETEEGEEQQQKGQLQTLLTIRGEGNPTISAF